MNLAQIKNRLVGVVGSGGTLTDVLTKLINKTDQTYSQIESMGGTVPTRKNMDNIADAIETIESSEA